MNLKLKYLLNRNLREHSEKVFEGISNGRKKALENWFNDKWAQLENIKNSLVAFEDDDNIIYNYLVENVIKHVDIWEIFVLNENGVVSVSKKKKKIGIEIPVAILKKQVYHSTHIRKLKISDGDSAGKDIISDKWVYPAGA